MSAFPVFRSGRSLRHLGLHELQSLRRETLAHASEIERMRAEIDARLAAERERHRIIAASALAEIERRGGQAA